jgi:hypothetical protein
MLLHGVPILGIAFVDAPDHDVVSIELQVQPTCDPYEEQLSTVSSLLRDSSGVH